MIESSMSRIIEKTVFENFEIIIVDKSYIAIKDESLIDILKYANKSRVRFHIKRILQSKGLPETPITIEKGKKTQYYLSKRNIEVLLSKRAEKYIGDKDKQYKKIDLLFKKMGSQFLGVNDADLQIPSLDELIKVKKFIEYMIQNQK